MKKFLLIIGCLFMGINSASALTLNEDGTYTNALGVNISSEQYEIMSKEFNDRWIDQFDESRVAVFSSHDKNYEEESVYSITTYRMDRLGNVLDEVTIASTKEEAEAVAKNDYLYVTTDGTIKDLRNTAVPFINYDYYATESKEVTIRYYLEQGLYTISLEAVWFKLPTIRQFDVLGVRWEQDANVTWLFGEQYSDEKYTQYTLSSENTKYTSRGVGVSMNLHNNAKKQLRLKIAFCGDNRFGNEIYGTYQHAKHSNANTLKISQSYSFASNGLGGVLYFSNSTYRNYYDGMQGVKWKNNNTAL